MSKSLLIYPYSSETSDILRNKSFRERYEVIHLCAFPGSGLERKDAGDVDRGGHIGIMVEEDYNIAIKDITDVLFSDYQNVKVKKEDIFEKIDKAYNLSKNVIMSKQLRKQYSNWKKEDVEEEYPILRWLKAIDKEKVEKLNGLGEMFDYKKLVFNEGIVEISTPLVGVVGTAQHTGKFHIQLQMVTELRRIGYKVSWIGSNWLCELFGGHEIPSFMTETNYNETEKILLLNRYVKYIETLEQPDIMIMGVPGGIMPCSKNITGDFGMLAYEMCQAAIPDLMILSVFFDEYQSNFFEEIKNCIKYRYSTKLSIVSICNRRIDWDEVKVINRNIVPYFTVGSHLVDTLIEKNKSQTNIELINLRNSADMNSISQNIIEELEDDHECIIF